VLLAFIDNANWEVGQEVWIPRFLGPSNCWLPIVGSTFSNCYKFNTWQFSLCYLDYDPCGMFLGITHKAKLEWQLIIGLYFGHIQGELMGFMSYPLWILWVISEYCSFSKTITTCHWGDIKQKSVFTMFENVTKFCHIFKMGSPLPFGWRHTWVVPLQTTHPNITRMLVSFLVNKKKN